ncbi:MAG: PDDEXK nuclease domain-containing protein, partial [Actinomycetota bacterium]|nr:PDDEXK nuclease domain-containing protein [Actinomycetota bacterium]
VDDDLRAVTPVDDGLFGDVAGLIDGARTRAAASVNSELVMLCWSIGKRVREEVLGGERGAYGQQVVMRLAERLTARSGRGWSRQNLERMVRFAAWFPDCEKCSTLSGKLTWSHVAELLTISDQRKRDFYATFAAHERWSVRTLRAKIAGKLYERTLAARGSAEGIEADLATLAATGTVEPSLAFRDPYVLDFLGLPPEHSEGDLERAILDEMQRFLLELGVGFAFVERQKRMTVDGRDYRLDLLLYHITMRCYVAIELKTRPLEPGDYGQMTLYLRWLDRHQRHPGDAAPIGLILCTEKGPEQVALLGLDSGEVRAAQYVVDEVRKGLARIVARTNVLGDGAG